MPRPRLVPVSISGVRRSGRIAAAAGGVALVGLPVVGAVFNRLRGGAGPEEAAAETLGAASSIPGLPGVLGAPVAEAERAAESAQRNALASGPSGADFGAGPGSWSLEGVPELLGFGGKAVSAGLDGAGEVAKLAGHGVRGLVEVAGAVGGALPDLGDVADVAGAAVEVAGAVLGAIGDGLGDLNF